MHLAGAEYKMVTAAILLSIALEETKRDPILPHRTISTNWLCQNTPGALVGPGGLEPPTNSLGNCCSIHLSYGPSRRNGGV